MGHILVAIDEHRDLELVELAIDQARLKRASLEIVCGVLRIWPTFYSTPSMSWVGLERELADDSAALLRTALARVGPDMSVSFRQVRGSAARTVRTKGASGKADVVICRRPRLGAFRRCQTVLMLVP